MFVDETTEEQEYKKGYDRGYTWLAMGLWNFLHPYGSFTYPDGHTIKGYIPGGPSFSCRARYGSIEYTNQNKLAHNLNKAWRNGWIDGINKYVFEHHLDYQQIPNER